MYTQKFLHCLEFTLEQEGGYAPRDTGGLTKYGITIPTLSEYLGRQASLLDIRNLTREVATAVYWKLFWVRAHCDLLPTGVDMAVFDFAVNSGDHRATAEYASVPHNNSSDSVKRICADRRTFVRKAPTYKVNGAGWEKRINRCEAQALFDITHSGIDVHIDSYLNNAKSNGAKTLVAATSTLLSGVGVSVGHTHMEISLVIVLILAAVVSLALTAIYEYRHRVSFAKGVDLLTNKAEILVGLAPEMDTAVDITETPSSEDAKANTDEVSHVLDKDLTSVMLQGLTPPAGTANAEPPVHA